MNCKYCKNEVFVNLENGSSQCTRCGWIALPNNPSPPQPKKNIKTKQKVYALPTLKQAAKN